MTSFKDLIAGLFVLVSIVLFLAFLAWAGKIRTFFHETRVVRVLVERLPPMPPGAVVRHDGVDVGEMIDIRLRRPEERARTHPSHPIELTLRVTASLPMTTEHSVIVTGDGMLGARYVRLQAGRIDAPPLAADGFLIGSLAGIDGILDQSEEAIHSLSRGLALLEKLLDPSGGAESLPGLVKRVGKLSDEVSGLAAGFDKTNQQASETLVEARTLVKSVQDVVTTNAPDLRRLLESAAGLPAEASKLTEAGRQSLDKLDRELTQLAERLTSTLRNVDELVLRNDRNLFLTLHHARVAAEELKLALARVRADPSQLLFGGSEDPADAEAAARKSLERDLVDRGLLPPRWKR